MKKYCVFLICFMALFAVSVFFPQAHAAKIIYVKGRVQVQPESSTVWNKAKVGMKVNIGDSIRTARHSEAQILLDENKKSFIDITEQTLVVINSTSADKINKLDLSHGKIFASVHKLQANNILEVSTPSSVAGVRGTSWSVGSNSKRDEISVYKDTVFVEAYDKLKKLLSKITVPQGFKVIVERFGKPGKLIPLNDREKKRWRGKKKKFLKNMKNISNGGIDKIKNITDNSDQISDQLEEKQEESGIGDREEYRGKTSYEP